MVNIHKLQQASLTKKPFRYAVIEGFLATEEVEQLIGHLPMHCNIRSKRARGSDKTYNVVNHVLLKLGATKNEDELLHPAWTRLLKEITSERYIHALSELLQENLHGCLQEITFKRYGFGDFISPHTDKADVQATHMLFLNTTWNANWGGQLHFLHDTKTVFQQFLPTMHHSVAFVQAVNSWHAVEPIREPTKSRLAIQVAFWNVRERKVAPGREEICLDERR